MPGYLKTLRAPLIAGREFTEADRHGAAPVAIISKSGAIFYYGGVQKALGRTLKGDEQQRTIVGVVDEFRHQNVRGPIRRRVFVPYLQQDPHQLTFLVRTAAAPAAMLETVRQAMHNLDPNLALDAVRTMETQLDMSMGQARTLALLATSFGLLAALMSAVGLYGVLAFDTLQRTREIGVRMALGADRSKILRTFLGRGLAVAFIGMTLGLAAAWLLRPVIAHLLADAGVDPSTSPRNIVMNGLWAAFLAAIAVFSATLTASWLPAIRAASIEPMEALRTE
jgi:putative ABC transport system permease protein